MSTLKEYRDTYYEFSGKLSENCRKLAFVGIAIVWIFKKDDGDTFILPTKLIVASMFLVLCLCFDLFQYVYQTLAWGFYHRFKEKQNPDPEGEHLAPKQINWPAIIFMWAKVLFVIIAYVIIFVFLCSRIKCI